MRAVLTLAFIVLLVVGAFKIFYRPATTPAVLQPPPSAPSSVALPDRAAEPPPSVLSPEQLKRVLDTTRDPNPNVRWEAVKFLKKSHAPQTDEILEDMMTRDTEMTVRRNVVLLIGDSGGPQAVRQLTIALRDMEPSVRIAALQALNHLGDFTAAPAISELLQDSDDGVRLAALNTLNALQSKREEELRIQRAKEEAERRRQEELMRQQQEKGR